MAKFYSDSYNTRYRLYFADINGNPKRLDIDQKNWGLQFYDYTLNFSAADANVRMSANYIGLDGKSTFITLLRGSSANITAASGTIQVDELSQPATASNFSIITEDFVSGTAGGIQEIIGTKDPVILKYNTGELFKKTILSSKCTINLYKMFDDEFIKFHEFPEKEFKIRIYNGITKSQYWKLNLLCPKTNQQAYTSDPLNYWERVAAVDGEYLCEGTETDIDANFQKFATNKSKFIDRILYDGGIVESEGAILANEINEVTDSYYQMYWQGYLVADTFKETWKPYPYKIQLVALDMLATTAEMRINPYGYNRLGGAQSQPVDPADKQNNQTYDIVDMLGRYFLRQQPTESISSGSTDVNIVGPDDSLYQYFFVQMDGLSTTENISVDFNNYYGFDDRFTYGESAAGEAARKNVIGQNVIFNDSYAVRKGKDVIENLLQYKNARLYQCWGQIVIGLVGTENGILDEQPSTQNFNDGNTDMMKGLKADVTNYFSNPSANRSKYFKIMRRPTARFSSTGNSGLQNTRGTGGTNVAGYMGQPMVKKIKRDIQPIKNDFKVEYLAPFKEVNSEVDRGVLNNEIGQVAANPTFEYNGGNDKEGGDFVVNENPKTGRRCFKDTSYFFSLPTSSSGNYLYRITTDERTFNSSGQDQRLRLNIGTPKIEVKLDFYVQCNGAHPDARLYYFVDLDSREIRTTPTNERDYFYDQKDRRWEKTTRLNYYELKGADDYNKWNSINIAVDKWDLYNAQPNGLSFLRGRIGFLALRMMSSTNVNNFEALYIDNMGISVDYMNAKKVDLRVINTATPNTKVFKNKQLPLRNINERGDGFDWEKQGTSANVYNGNLVDTALEQLSLFSIFVPRYEFTCRDNYNDFNMANDLYVDFENQKDDSLTYLDGLTINIKSNDIKVIAHKGTLNSLNSNNCSTYVEDV
jgi:hypothetical protein